MFKCKNCEAIVPTWAAHKCVAVGVSDNSGLLTLSAAVKEELPHIKYAIDCLSADGVSLGPLSDIYTRLKALSDKC